MCFILKIYFRHFRHILNFPATISRAVISTNNNYKMIVIWRGLPDQDIVIWLWHYHNTNGSF